VEISLAVQSVPGSVVC